MWRPNDPVKSLGPTIISNSMRKCRAETYSLGLGSKVKNWCWHLMTFILLLVLDTAYPTLGHGNQKQKQIKSENLSYSSKSSQITLNPQLLGYPQHCDTAILKLGYLTPALELGSPLYNWPIYVVFHQVILMQIYSYS